MQNQYSYVPGSNQNRAVSPLEVLKNNIDKNWSKATAALIIALAAFVIATIAGIWFWVTLSDNNVQLSTRFEPVISVSDPEIFEKTLAIPCQNKSLGSLHEVYRTDTYLSVLCQPPENSCLEAICLSTGFCDSQLKVTSDCATDEDCAGGETCRGCTCQPQDIIPIVAYTPEFNTTTVRGNVSVIDTTPNTIAATWEDLGSWVKVSMNFDFNISDVTSRNIGFNFTLPTAVDESQESSGMFTLASADLFLETGTSTEFIYGTGFVDVDSGNGIAHGVNQNGAFTMADAATTSLSGSLTLLYAKG